MMYTYVYVYPVFPFAFTAHRAQRAIHACTAGPCGGMPHPQYVAYGSV